MEAFKSVPSEDMTASQSSRDPEDPLLGTVLLFDCLLEMLYLYCCNLVQLLDSLRAGGPQSSIGRVFLVTVAFVSVFVPRNPRQRG